MVGNDKVHYKEEIKKCINDLKHIKTIYKQIPNLLTLSRAIGGPVISVLFLTGHPVIGVISVILLFSTDMVDGKLARHWDIVSKFGADLDAFCDKIMFLGLSIPLMVTNPLVILNFILEGVISLINVLGRVNGLDTKTVFFGKVKTCVLLLMLGVGYLVQYLNVPVVLLNTLIGFTFVSQGIAINDYIKEYKRMNNEKSNIDIVCENDKDEKEIILEQDNNLIEELRYEKELLLENMELDNNIKPLIRKRSYGKKKRY